MNKDGWFVNVLRLILPALVTIMIFMVNDLKEQMTDIKLTMKEGYALAYDLRQRMALVESSVTLLTKRIDLMEGRDDYQLLPKGRR